MSELYAEDVGNYWKTSKTSPDTWLEKAKREIERAGGKALREAFGREGDGRAAYTWLEKAKREIERAGGKALREAFGREGDGRAAYMLEFELGGDVFRVVWPVLPSRSGNERAARIQAATMLYHDVKARGISAKVLGVRSAFFSYLALPDGRTASQASAPELMREIPQMLGGHPQLVSGEIVDG
jgi:hypothetical protein